MRVSAEEELEQCARESRLDDRGHLLQMHIFLHLAFGRIQVTSHQLD